MLRHLVSGLVLLLTACALPAERDGIAATPVLSWSPSEVPRAVVIALHGFNDSKSAFAEFGARAAKEGVLVEAFDQAGFGERPDRGRWPGVEALVADVHGAVREARRRHPGLLVFVLGESMGAAVAAVALARDEAPPVDGVILSAPAVWGGEALSQRYQLALRVLAGLLPPLKVSGGGLGILASDNLEALRALGRDPLYIHETRLDAVAGLVDLMDEARRAAPALRVPVLVLSGARDQVVPPQAQASFVRTLPAEACSVVTYLDGWHLLLRDLQRAKVFADLLAWIEGQALPSRLDRPCGPAATPA